MRGSVSTKRCNENDGFAGAGINYFGLLKDDGSYILGLGVAHACRECTSHEAAFELTY
jgi:hypothetical protein